MKKSTLGIVIATVIVVGGGGGCIIRQQLQAPSEPVAKIAPQPEPTPTPAAVDTAAMNANGKNTNESAAATAADSPKDAMQSPPSVTVAPEPNPAEGSRTVAEVALKGAVNAFPTDKQVLSADEAKSPIAFRWTPLVPKPKEPVTYRLRVWQLMQGQNGTQAVKSNQPIVTKDVDNETQVTVSGIYTGPCKPPYLCDFVWAVEAVTSTGMHVEVSDPTTFNVAAEAAAADSGATGSTAGTR